MGEPFAARVILPTPDVGDRSVERVSGRLLQTSLRVMREQGLEADYFARLEPSLHETVRSLRAGDWLDVSVATQHYETLNALIPDSAAQLEIGRSISARRRNSYLLSVVTKAIRTSRISPLTVLRRIPSIWKRLLIGGGVGIHQSELHGALLTVCAAPLGPIAYFRAAVAGVLESGVQFVAPRAEVGAPRLSEQIPGAFELAVRWS